MKKLIFVFMLLSFFSCLNDDDFNNNSGGLIIAPVTFHGTVIDCDNGNPIPNAKVLLHHYLRDVDRTYLGVKQSTTTDNKGKYSIIVDDYDFDERYQTEASAEHYWSHRFGSSANAKQQALFLKPVSWIKLKLQNQSNDTLVSQGLLSYNYEYELIYPNQSFGDCRKVVEYFDIERGNAEQTILIKGIGNSEVRIRCGFQLINSTPTIGVEETVFLPLNDTLYHEMVF